MDIAAYDSTVCNECKKLCKHYLDEHWNCQGDSEPCRDFENRLWYEEINDEEYEAIYYRKEESPQCIRKI